METRGPPPSAPTAMGGYTVMNDRVWTVRRHLRRRLGGSQRGATAVEYGLLLALIVVVAFGAMAGFGQENQEVYRAFTRIMEAMISR